MNQSRQMSYDQAYTVQVAQQNFLKHAALAEHYERLKMANASNDSAYYRYAELQYYHKSMALHFKAFFSAMSFI
jgi:hypothetical protein